MSADTSQNPSLDLGRFVTVLKRRWLTVLIGLLIGVALAATILVYTSRTFTATTLVNINVISAQPFNQSRPDSDLIDAQTEIQLARSSEVVSSVSRRLSGSTPSQVVRRATTAELLADGTVLRIQYAASTAARAEAGADAVAEEYLAYRSQLAQARVDAVVKQLNIRRAALTDQLTDIQELLSTTGQIPIRARLQAQTQVTNQALSALTQELTSLQSINTGGGTILTTANPGTTVVSVRTAVVMASGVLGGLLLGCVLAALVNRLDRRVRDEHDVVAAGGGSVLGRVPRGGGRVDPIGQEADAVRSLRERLLATLSGPRPVVALAEITGHGPPASIATNLALSCAHIGMNVHLILPEHPQGYVDDLSEVLDLTPVESGHRLPLTVSRRYPNVSVSLPTHTDWDDNSADQVIDLLRETDHEGYELTLIALPANSSRSLHLAVGRTGHAFVLVVAERRTKRDEVSATSAELAAVNAVVHGTVLVGRDRRFGRRSRDREDRHEHRLDAGPVRVSDGSRRRREQPPTEPDSADAGEPHREVRATRS